MRADRSTSSMTQLAYTCFRICQHRRSPDTAVPDGMTNTSISAFGSPWELTTLIGKRGTT